MLVHTVACAQRKRGHKVTVVARRNAPLAKAIEKEDIGLVLYKSGLHLLSFPYEIRRLLEDKSIDVVHFHQLRAVRRLVPLLPKNQSSPVYVFTEHSPRPHSIATWFNSYALSLLDAIIVVSESQRGVVAKQLNLPAEKLTVVLNGVDAEKYSPPTFEQRERFRSEFGIKNDVKAVVCAGRVVKPKGQDLFAEAALQLLKEMDNVQFIVCGEVDKVNDEQRAYIDQIKRRIASAGLEQKILFHGFVEDIAKCFSAADVVVVPSRIEPFGLVAAEAMACGTPVVVADAGALPEVVDFGKCGIVVKKDDPSDLARGIRRALTEDTTEMASRARKRIESTLSLPAHLNSLETVYNQLLQKRSE